MSPIKGTVRIHQQRLRHPFGTSRGIDATIPTVLVELADGAVGEGSPVRYKGQTAAAVAADVEKLLGSVDGAAPLHVQLEALAACGAASAARAAVDIALHDLHARRRSEPIRRMLGLAAVGVRETSLTIGLDEPEVMEAKAREAARWPILKVKLGRGLKHDADVLRRIRRVAPAARLTVDANAGWDAATAESIFPTLLECGVELLEQPTRIGDLDALAQVNDSSPIPVYADEDAQDPASLPALVGKVRGINIKLMKCGGIAPALEMIAFARRQGWGVLLGCMVETGIGIGAATQLAGLADWLDLDGALLSTNDPTDLLHDEGAPWRLATGEKPGLGVRIVHGEG